ncbi:MAG: hypothetical protein DCC55_16105 [Chloroflexi bacterium]|nr:MAG: hypothetical protein DCC55_16105 [Chloroflexota bacterium]
MAETYETTTERERQRTLNTPNPTENDATPPPVGVYDRPERPVRSTGNVAGILLLLLVLAILAYFVFQWLT